MDLCEACGAELEDGRCPACLMQLALDAPTRDSGPALSDAAFPAGSRIGPYCIERVLGEGGMGIVHLARQEAPIQRPVALKVIKRGMESRKVVARFEAERQALAVMEHPAIAGVYDAGETEDGRPFFVMEFVDGEPISDYCRRAELEERARLELFARVCDGVQHAHRRGIIHRDLKPSNILVAERDGEAQPKIIDFGIAKAIEHREGNESLLTELGVMVGTPEYMSPEQAELTPMQVDTRSDLFSLGVVLHELLTDALPFGRSELRGLSYEALRERLRDTRPSGEARRLQGDLKLIVAKALEADPADRYESPADLAADLRRYLAGEPVVARAPTPWYVLRRLIARHRLASGVAALFLVMLLGFSLWMTLLYRQSQSNLERALDAEAESTKFEVEKTLIVS